MKKKWSLHLILVPLVIFCLHGNVLAEGVWPFQLALITPVQVPSEETSIHGIRINAIYGTSENVIGFDFGLVNRTRGDMKGLGFGFANIVDGDASAWQFGVINYVGGQNVGLQTGFYNHSEKMRGFQFGAINWTRSLHGLQIGVLNFNMSGEPLTFFPIINFGF
jgi:hypothetical protein